MLAACGDRETGGQAIPGPQLTSIPPAAGPPSAPTDTSLPTFTPPEVEDLGDVDISKFVAKLPANTHGCAALTKRKIDQLLVENIRVVQDKAQGGPDQDHEEYYCTLNGASNQDEVNQKGLIERYLTVNVMRYGGPDDTDPQTHLASQWDLVKTMAVGENDGKPYTLPGASEAFVEYHPDQDISSVTLLARVQNVIVWVEWNDTDISRERARHDADGIMRTLVGRLR